MAKGKYAKGYRNEKKTRDHLLEHGYLVVESRGSHGLWDIVGVGAGPGQEGRVILIQVKTNKLPTNKQMQPLRDFPTPTGGAKQVWVWHDRVNVPEVVHL